MKSRKKRGKKQKFKRENIAQMNRPKGANANFNALRGRNSETLRRPGAGTLRRETGVEI
jgi:hypothetical protein